jgi:hypothetical protein
MSFFNQKINPTQTQISANNFIALKELVNLLLITNQINLNIDEFLAAESPERIAMLRDLKINQILDK